MILGCGNAKFSEDLYDAGFHNQWNVDISDVVIQQMKDRNQHRPKMVYEVMDVCDMNYPDNFFDVAIDKSTIDTILCGENPVLSCFTFLKECQRVIK